MEVVNAIEQRFSCRAFLDTPVADDRIQRILELARHAPSSTNMQPWQVAVIRGNTRQALARAMTEARQQGAGENPDYQYYPSSWFEPYAARRKATGLALYQALGIGKQDQQARLQAWCNNYHWFGAPVGLLVMIDRRLGEGSLIDAGIFVQHLVLAAQQEGLDSCIQASLGEFPDIARQILELPEHWTVVCGVAIGHGDPEAAVNQYRTPRAEVSEFTRWYD